MEGPLVTMVVVVAHSLIVVYPTEAVDPMQCEVGVVGSKSLPETTQFARYVTTMDISSVNVGTSLMRITTSHRPHLVNMHIILLKVVHLQVIGFWTMVEVLI